MASVKQMLSAEGADPLVLAGVNDSNLVELARATGVRVSLLGDSLMLDGEGEALGLAARVASAMIDVARMSETLSLDDVRSLVADGGAGSELAANGNLKIALPGTGRIVQP